MGGGYFVKIDKRWLSLFLPFLVWNIIWIAYTLAKNYYLARQGLHGDIELHTVSQIAACFWAVGQGDMPFFPIAGYTWFLRDLFVFSLLAPAYLYIYNRRRLCWIALVISIVLISFRVMEPYYNGALFVGGLLGNRKIYITSYVNKIRWGLIIPLVCISYYVFYYMGRNPLAYLSMLCFTLCFLFKLSVLLKDNKVALNLAAFSTFLYLSHVLVLNFVGKILVKMINPADDLHVVLTYYMNFILSIAICYVAFYVLKALKCNTAFLLLSGGRQ